MYPVRFGCASTHRLESGGQREERGHQMKFAAISIADYCEATQGLDEALERLFFRLLLWMYSTEAMLPDDDRANARRFGYDIRRYRSLKAKLLAFPKRLIVARDGQLVSDRAAKDIAAAQARKVAKAAAKAGDMPPLPLTMPGDIPPKIAPTSGDIPPKNAREINAGASSSPSPASPDRTLGRSVGHHPSHPTAAADAATGRPTSGSDRSMTGKGQSTPTASARERIIATVQHAMGPSAEPGDAEDWVDAEIAESGLAPLNIAHRMLAEKRAARVPIRNPLAWMSRTASTIAARSRGPAPAEIASDDSWKADIAALKARAIPRKTSGHLPVSAQ